MAMFEREMGWAFWAWKLEDQVGMCLCACGAQWLGRILSTTMRDIDSDENFVVVVVATETRGVRRSMTLGAEMSMNNGLRLKR